ncbi:hypothetical protein EXM22_02930 [Oceanispirochaeta crateris]|uniref:Capsule assembly Wzi family protein n=1 Tax=Oceanispirochaeta crateris TaxID=2518645 RepID=A0A5C1QI69_9SPIO|nr:capsule assembly Wzi family protein [Oceanispirochaeta crateris]QEN06988.1 hypothetical protein EXM22_02930 [Oceanispirochaeta crateris]
MKRYFLFLPILFLFITTYGVSNEKIQSTLDQYYTALSLTGVIERPFLQYKSFSTNTWTLSQGDHPWQDQNIQSSPLYKSEEYSLFLETPQWFQSYNLNSPHGINDGGLWQGKGYNSSYSGGLSLLSEFVDLTIYPEFYFSQNQDFVLQELTWSGSEYAYPYSGIDAPQRFGNSSFMDFSWGQSQIRFKYNGWSLGIGNENVWIGHGSTSAHTLSNNADGFPHVDVGVSKADTSWGDVEFKMWWGALKSSDYNVNVDPDTYSDFLSGVHLAWSPFFFPGLTMGINKTSQVSFEEFSMFSLIAAVDPGVIQDYSGGVLNGSDNADGRASITWNWLFDSVGFEFYGEWTTEDYVPSLDHLLVRPNHASGYILGLRQHIPITDYNDRFFIFNAEFSSLMWSRDYYLNGLGWGGGFYRHSMTNLGYSNSGQFLGTGYGPGGDNQHLQLDYYAPFGKAGIYADRTRYNDTKLYSASNILSNNEDWGVPVQWSVGLDGYYFLTHHFSLGGDMAYIFDRNFQTYKNLDYQGIYIAIFVEYRF